jgi:DNA polymerase-3 subunit epsilon
MNPVAPTSEHALLRAALELSRRGELDQLRDDAGLLPPRSDNDGRRREGMLRALERSGVRSIDALEYLDARRAERALTRGRAGARRAAIVDRLFGEQTRPTPPPGVRVPPTFVALDFETANPQRDSACSVAAVRVEAGVITERRAHLIRPVPRGLHRDPRELFAPRMVDIHGIRWRDVRAAPAFREVWMSLTPLLEGAQALVAHNAPFDRSVLEASCRSAGLPVPGLPFVCTVRMARSCWSLPSARLPVVARYLGIPLRHHDPLSDATVTAQIACAAHQRDPTLFTACQLTGARATRQR